MLFCYLVDILENAPLTCNTCLSKV